MKPFVWRLAPLSRPPEQAKVALSELARARLDLAELRRERRRDPLAETLAAARVAKLERRRG